VLADGGEVAAGGALVGGHRARPHQAGRWPTGRPQDGASPFHSNRARAAAVIPTAKGGRESRTHLRRSVSFAGPVARQPPRSRAPSAVRVLGRLHAAGQRKRLGADGCRGRRRADRAEATLHPSRRHPSRVPRMGEARDDDAGPRQERTRCPARGRDARPRRLAHPHLQRPRLPKVLGDYCPHPRCGPHSTAADTVALGNLLEHYLISAAFRAPTGTSACNNPSGSEWC